MRKLTLTPISGVSAHVFIRASYTLMLSLFLSLSTLQLTAQCITLDNTISGTVFYDVDMNGINESSDSGMGNVLVNVYDNQNNLVGSAISSSQGEYMVTGLDNGADYKLSFTYGTGYHESVTGSDNGTAIQIVTAPSCNVSLGLADASQMCQSNPELLLSCFVVGGDGENDDVETIIGLEHNFGTTSNVVKYASKKETGSVWGVAWSGSQNAAYSASFVKQYAGLTQHGHGAIFKTSIDQNNQGATTLHVDLASRGITLGDLAVTDESDCNYGAQVGRVGIGPLVIDDQEANLYTINLFEKKVLEISATQPNQSAIKSFAIPNPGCNGGEAAPFALKWYNGKLYVGVTCTAEYSQVQSDSRATVYELDLATENFTEIFSTDYIKGYWYDSPSNSGNTMHWLTDIDFSDNGLMLLSLTDRIGHRFCNTGTGRVDIQNPDLLVAYNNNGTWTLENNGIAGPYTGTGVSNGQGPGGGEFFGDDFWISNPSYHPEIALGSIFALPGSGEVVASVYDPITDSYSGGLHRYNTTTGRKSEAIQLYSHVIDVQFGKATGFGDITSRCGGVTTEIGNYVWHDTNGNGLQDAGEDVLEGVKINLVDENCYVIASTTTDASGQYVFNDTNVDADGNGVFDGLAINTPYFVTLDSDQYDIANQSFTLGSDAFSICLQANASDSEQNADLENYTGSCSTLQGAKVIPVTLSIDQPVDHSLDIALCSEGEKMIDLALKKIILGQKNRQVNDTVSFEIFVYNQGTSIADEIVVTDYLVSGYELIEDLSPEWRGSGDILKTRITDPLAPGEKTSVFIHLRVKATPGLEYINVAEISAVVSNECPDCIDIDSTPDDDPFNDAGGIPNAPLLDDVIDGDGTVDEDDHDPARVILADIALKKELLLPQKVYKAGEDADYVITLYNQGTEALEDVQVVDYLPAELVFDNTKNTDWQVVAADLVTYDVPGVINPGEVVEIPIVLTIKDDVEDGMIVNYAEVTRIKGVETGTDLDFDSTPDMTLGNDSGGIANSSNDNRVDDSSGMDEDDQDPASLRVASFDMALFKTANTRTAEAGDDVDFTITVVNQGTIDATNVVIYDYLPLASVLNDADWAYLSGSGNSIASYTITDVIPAGQSINVEITLTIPANFSGTQFLNIAEIGSVTDTNGNDRSNEDVDSTPDSNMNDDNGGIVGSTTDDEIDDDGTLDEDDHDPARIIVLNPNLVTNNECLENASNETDGQFKDVIEITSEDGESWYIHNVIGLFSSPSPAPPAAPTAFVTGPTGDMLVMGSPSNGLNTYTLEGVHIDGLGYSIILTNGLGDFITVENIGTYTKPVIDGPLALCGGSMATYTATGGTAPFMWVLPAEATPTGPVNEETVELVWTGTTGAYDLTFTSDGCAAPITETVTIGSVSASLACIGDVNISVGGDCEFLVTPEMISADVLDPNAAYAVILMDAAGNIIPNATVTPELLNQRLTVKLMDGCSGNACWSHVTFEDKVAPEVLCEDITLSCAEMLAYQGPLGLDNCDNIIPVEIVSETSNNLFCDPNFARIINRKYKATDANGNESTLCEQMISISLLDISTVVIPDNFMISDQTNLSCRRFIADAEGNPSPLSTGVPTVEGIDLYPSDGSFCRILTNYSDYIVLDDGCNKKIIRTWTIYDANCSDNLPEKFEQTIEIKDDEDPEIDPIADITVSSNGTSCFGTVVLPVADVLDLCIHHDDLEVDIEYGTNFINDSNGSTVSLPMGTTSVTYRVYDICGNSASTSFNVTVEDRTAPVVICDQNTVVSIDNFGEAVVAAAVFDDGSYDDCSLDRMEVRRLGSNTTCSTAINFGSTVTFCCEDVGTTHAIELRVVDSNGNSNTCEVNVFVDDKFAPSIIAPANVTVECGTIFDFDNLSATYGKPTIIDACGVTQDSSFIVNSDQCGINNIVRTFMASDTRGTVSTTQVITVVNSNPFVESDIDWPNPVFESQASCIGEELLPENLPDGFGYPEINEDACDLVGATFEDMRFDFVTDGDACFKILRRWTVIDWCQKDALGAPISFTFDQVLKVNNFTAPVIVSGCEDITVDNFEDDCGATFVDLTVTVEDFCTPDQFIQHGYQIDFGSDGSIESMNNQSGATANASGDFPNGVHTVFFYFEDMCGNEVTCTRVVTVVNKKAPFAYCRDGVVVVLTPVYENGDVISEEACLYVEQVDGGSFHSCVGVPINLSFSADTTDNKMLFDCDNIGLIDIELWVTDINDNTSKCTLTVDVQDNNDEDGCLNPKDCLTLPSDTLTVTQCNPDLTPAGLNSMPVVADDCFCDDSTITFADEAIAYPNADCSAIKRTFTITFNCTNNPIVCTFEQIINVINQEAPVVICPSPSSITVSSNAVNCNGIATIPEATFSGVCNSGVVVSNNSAFADRDGADASGNYPVGTTTFQFFATDACGNSSSCDYTVIVEDGVDPVCTLMDVSLVLDAMGNASVSYFDLNNGSVDSCGTIASTSVIPSIFDCSDIGDNVVNVVVTDDSGNTTACSATVTITDDAAPVCSLMDITVDLDAMGTVNVTGAQLNNGSTDACGFITSFDVTPSTFDCSNIGDNTVNVVVTDNSGNTSTCTAVVTVMDDVAPICMLQDITVSIGANNEAIIDSAAIDNGSMDPCGSIVSFDIVPSILDCSNIGDNTVNVVVTDDSGNTTTCTTNVFLEDNTTPICNLKDITVSLDNMGMVTFTGEDLNDGSTAGCNGTLTFNVVPNFFGCNDIGDETVVVTVTDNNNNSTTCSATVTIEDNMPPMITSCPGDTTLACGADLSDLSVFGDVTATDNCDLNLDTLVNVVMNVNACNVGVVTRTFILTDNEGNSNSCMQNIFISAPVDPFAMDDITFPADTAFLADCDPMSMMGNTAGMPTIDSTASDCFNISIDFVDNSAGISCQDTFDRLWTVIDSCQLDGSGAGVFTFTQVIVLNDTLAPILVTPGDTIIACGDEMLPGAVFDCSSITSVTNDSPFAFDNNSADVSGNYPDGSMTTIIVSATDICGNMAADTFTITVMDTIRPELDCKKLIFEIPDTQMLTLFPEDFICGYFDNCTDSLDATFFFTEPFIGADSLTMPTTLIDSLPLTCANLTAQKFEYIAGFDEAGNFFRCRVAYTLLDPNGFCTSIAEVKGSIVTETLDQVADVNIDLLGSSLSTYTDSNGGYAFPAMSIGGNYIVMPSKNDNPLNGVNTADIVKIQKHILGMERLTSPYKHIAADVNKSGTISTLDILELRKMILGIQVGFDTNESWRMVDAAFEFTTNEAPLDQDFEESYAINNLNSSMDVDFIGVKIGDVTEDAQAGLLSPQMMDRSVNKMSWKLVKSATSETGVYDVFASKAGVIDGFQMAIKVSSGSILEILPSSLELTPIHYRIDDDMVWISYDAIASEISSVRPLFTIRVDGDKAPTLADRNMLAQVYSDNLTYDLSLLSIEQTTDDILSLGQNHPNPWQNVTTIEFELDRSQLVELKVFNANAQLLMSKRIAAKKGVNSFKLDDKLIATSGVLYYELETASGKKEIRKMIKLK